MAMQLDGLFVHGHCDNVVSVFAISPFGIACFAFNFVQIHS
jgi:hypothetical protein